MTRNHFRLLTLTRGQLAGPCARMLDQEARQGFRARAVRAASRVLPQAIELLGLEAGLDEAGEFWARPTGLLAGGLGKQLAEAVLQGVRSKGRPIARRDGQLVFNLFQPAVPSGPAMKVIASHLHRERTGRPLPATATLQVTTACQCDCVHCSAAKYRGSREDELTTDEWKSVIRQTEELGIVNITFTGGEALLRPDIYELVAWVNKEEANAMMFTNGLLLNRERAARLREAGLFSLLVSLDSPNPQEHDRMRGAPGCWEKAVAGIRSAMAEGLLVGISTYATRERLHAGDVMAVIELGRQLGVPEVVVFDLVPTGKLLRGDQSLVLAGEDREAICRLEEEVNGREGYPHVISQSHVEGPTGSGCYGAWYQYFATAYGDVTPCDFMPITFGNLRRDRLADIWEKMTSHAACREHCDHCRMQDPVFRERWVDPIPSLGPFPYPAEKLSEEAAVAAAAPGES